MSLWQLFALALWTWLVWEGARDYERTFADR